jgi:hypothetical protein
MNVAMTVPAAARALLAIVALLVALVLGAAAFGRSSGVRIRVVPSRVTAGASVAIAARVSPAGALCGGTIRGAPKTLALRTRSARHGTVSWTIKVPASSPGGTWAVRVTCARAGRATARLTVTPRAKIVVLDSGFSLGHSSAFCGDACISFGTALRNVSPDEDELRVKVVSRFFDANRRLVKQLADVIKAIPAGATYYYGFAGNYVSPYVPKSLPARVDVSVVHIGAQQRRSIGSLPPVTGLQVADDTLPFGGGTDVLGDVTNPYAQTISQAAKVTAVCFDASGKVIGGGSASTNTAVSPGGGTGFRIWVGALTQSQIASTRVTVEPRFDDAALLQER